MISIWDLDMTHSSVGFSVKHLMICRVHGGFRTFSGTLNLDSDKLENSTAVVSIDAGSIDTKDETRDAHLKGKDFFDVQKYPKIEFVVTKIESKDNDRFQVTGNLTLHGQTKEIALDFKELSQEIKDPSGKIKIGTSATAKLSRKDFGLLWNTQVEAGGVLVSDEVSIWLDLEFIKR